MEETFNKLPKQLQIAMEYLLSANVLNSWTVQGNDKQTSIIIRFQMDNDTVTDLNSVKYRRVPPSQINRDRIRMECRKQNDYQDPCSEAPPQGNETHGPDTSKTMDTTVVKVKHQGGQGVNHQSSPPVTRSRSRISAVAEPSPIPQVDGAGVNMTISESESQDMSSVHSDPDTAPCPTVLVKSSTGRYEVTRHCGVCHKFILYKDVIQCCYQCREMFCSNCLTNVKSCPHGHVVYAPFTLSEYTGTFPT